jgi:hypothetical protein
MRERRVRQKDKGTPGHQTHCSASAHPLSTDGLLSSQVVAKRDAATAQA